MASKLWRSTATSYGGYVMVLLGLYAAEQLTWPLVVMALTPASRSTLIGAGWFMFFLGYACEGLLIWSRLKNSTLGPIGRSLLAFCTLPVSFYCLSRFGRNLGAGYTILAWSLRLVVHGWALISAHRGPQFSQTPIRDIPGSVTSRLWGWAAHTYAGYIFILVVLFIPYSIAPIFKLQLDMVEREFWSLVVKLFAINAIGQSVLMQVRLSAAGLMRPGMRIALSATLPLLCESVTFLLTAQADPNVPLIIAMLAIKAGMHLSVLFASRRMRPERQRPATPITSQGVNQAASAGVDVPQDPVRKGWKLPSLDDGSGPVSTGVPEPAAKAGAVEAPRIATKRGATFGQVRSLDHSSTGSTTNPEPYIIYRLQHNDPHTGLESVAVIWLRGHFAAGFAQIGDWVEAVGRGSATQLIVTKCINHTTGASYSEPVSVRGFVGPLFGLVGLGLVGTLILIASRSHP